MLRRLICIVAIALLTVLMVVNGCALAKDGIEKKSIGGAPPPSTQIDPLAERLMKEMGEFLKAAKEISFHADINYDDPVPPDGKIQYGASADFAAKRPDKLYFECFGDRSGRRFWYDGKSITVLDLAHNVYGEIAADPPIDAALDKVMKSHGWSLPLYELLTVDPNRILRSGVKQGYYVGLHSVDGVRCHHLVFMEDRIDWQIWIEDGAHLVPRKIVITYKTLSTSPQYTAVLSRWEFDARMPDVVFSAILPKGAEKIDFLRVVPEEARKP
jgi:hypothetical protein